MTWLDAAPWLGTGGTLLAGAVAVLYLRWRLQRAEDDRDLWRTSSRQLTTQMTELATAARDERQRQVEVIRALRSQLDVATANAADAALADPAAADRYVLGSLREAAAATDAAAHPHLPGPTAPDAAPAGDRGGHR